MVSPPVVMFLSTGRCGTQWLTAALRELYPAIVAAHEPIGPLYRPRRYFRRYRDPAAILEVPEVAEHVLGIEGAGRPYVETGWPLFPALPLLGHRLRERLRIVHLTRHPVPSALSHLAHQSYAGSPREDAYTRLATLAPWDPGVFAPEYRDCWEQLTAYEKCLFWWGEVHQFGLELPHRLPGIPFLRVKSEAMLAGEPATLAELLEFMQLPWDERWCELAGRVVDRWRHHTDAELDPLAIHRHRRAVDVAHALGYDMASLDVAALSERYRGAPDPGLDRIGRFEGRPAG
jgi:hypothetical protein